MQSDLDLLIELYEGEKQSLERMMKEYIDEFEYLAAYHHSEALAFINHQLYFLYKFKGPLHEEKERLERMIKMLPKINDEKLAPYMRPHWEKGIEDQKNKVKLLSEQKSKWFNDNQEIDDALFDLYERKSKKIRLLLDSEDNFYLDFELMQNNILVISIELDAVLNSDNIFREDDTYDRPFKGLGFKLNDKGDKLLYQYDMTGFKEATPIKMLLSRIVYDVYTSSIEASLIIYK
jgi:hypothetical protein